MTVLGSLAVMGGTFNPVHLGHLRSAIEIKQALGVDLVKLIPAALPPHRDNPGIGAKDRLQMLKLALTNVEGLAVDDIEFQRSGRSFTYDTLLELRASLGSIPIFLALGIDAFQEFHSWYRWREISDLCHLAILERPGYSPDLADELANWFKDREGDSKTLLKRPFGGIVHLALTQLDISSTKIRQLAESGQSIDFLVPESVKIYIEQERLYRLPTEIPGESG